jgi:hypothetical protein
MMIDEQGVFLGAVRQIVPTITQIDSQGMLRG